MKFEVLRFMDSSHVKWWIELFGTLADVWALERIIEKASPGYVVTSLATLVWAGVALMVPSGMSFSWLLCGWSCMSGVEPSVRMYR